MAVIAAKYRHELADLFARAEDPDPWKPYGALTHEMPPQRERPHLRVVK